jgi:hypothetical protein
MENQKNKTNACSTTRLRKVVVSSFQSAKQGIIFIFPNNSASQLSVNEKKDVKYKQYSNNSIHTQYIYLLTKLYKSPDMLYWNGLSCRDALLVCDAVWMWAETTAIYTVLFWYMSYFYIFSHLTSHIYRMQYNYLMQYSVSHVTQLYFTEDTHAKNWQTETEEFQNELQLV